MATKRRDARKLDHKTLEEIRIRAVEQVQAGESPEVVIKALGFSRACIYEWLAWYREGGWEALRAKPIAGRPRRLTGKQDSLDLSDSDDEESAATEVSVCVVDAHDDREIDW